MKGLLVLLLVLVLAGCGDFQWFPEDGTTTTPPVTPTQQTFNNTSTASGVSLPTLPVVNTTDSLSVTDFRAYETNRDATKVFIGFDVEVANANTTDINVKVTIAAKDASQSDISVTTTTATVVAGGRKKWYPTASLFINDYERIKSWTVAVEKVP